MTSLEEFKAGLDQISGVRSTKMTTRKDRESLRVDWAENPYNYSRDLEALGSPDFVIVDRETNNDQLPIVFYAEREE